MSSEDALNPPGHRAIVQPVASRTIDPALPGFSRPRMKAIKLLAPNTLSGLLLAGMAAGCRTEKVEVHHVPPPPRTVIVTNTVYVQAPAPIAAPVVANPSPTTVAGPAPSQGQAAPPAAPKEARPGAVVISPQTQEIAKLAQAGVAESVLLSYVATLPANYRPTADEIVYLTDLGISEPVMTALMKRGVADASSVPAVAAAPAPAGIVGLSATNPPQPAAVAPGNEGPVQQQYVVAQPVPQSAQPVPTAAPVPQVAAPPAQAYVVQPPPTTSYTYFYESLSPYGTWINYPGYGYCWQPTVSVTVSDWRPYGHRGRWLYTDCGWYWQSDYSWGWAPFHYGRWVHTSNCGWLWTPDTVWGPAWVTWRHGGDHCGWAPLPPGSVYTVGVGFSFHGSRVSADFAFGLRDHHYTFVPAGRLIDRDPWGHHVSGARHTAVFRETTVVNNYTVVNNTTIVNGGIDRDRISAHTRQEVRKVPIRDVERPLGGPVGADRVSPDGKALGVYRPKLPEQAAKPPTTVPVRTVAEVTQIRNSPRSEIGVSPAAGVSAAAPKSGLVAPRSSRGASADPSVTPPSSRGPGDTGAAGNRSVPPNANFPSGAQPGAAAGGTRPSSTAPSLTPSPVRGATQPPKAGEARPVPTRPQAAAAPAANEPSAPGWRVQPGSSSALKPAVVPQTAPLQPTTGFRQDYRKIDPPATSGVLAPKFQNQGNYNPQAAPAQSYQAPAVNPNVGTVPTTGFRGPQFAPQPAPQQPAVRQAPPNPAPNYATPVAPRPQQGQGGQPPAQPQNPNARRGDGKYQPN